MSYRTVGGPAPLSRALILGPAGDLRRQLAVHLTALGLTVISLAHLARKDLERIRGARIVVFCQTGSAQHLDAQQMRDYGLGQSVAVAVDVAGNPPPVVHAALPAPVRDTDLIGALAAAGYQVPANEELLRIHETVLRLVNGNAAITAQLVSSLLDTGQSDLDDYQRECADSNWIDAGSRAHRLGGTARMSGCHTLIALCAQAEAFCAQGNIAGIEAVNRLLVPGVQRLCAVLRALTGHRVTAA